LSVFLNATIADQLISTIDNQIGVGLICTRPFGARPKDEIALAFGRTDVMAGRRSASGCRTKLGSARWPSRTPSMSHPDGDSRNEDVVVIGLKTSIGFRSASISN
jgi:hypothetical protein